MILILKYHAIKCVVSGKNLFHSFAQIKTAMMLKKIDVNGKMCVSLTSWQKIV